MVRRPNRQNDICKQSCHSPYTGARHVNSHCVVTFLGFLTLSALRVQNQRKDLIVAENEDGKIKVNTSEKAIKFHNHSSHLKLKLIMFKFESRE